MKTSLRKLPYRLLREGRKGMPALYGIAVGISYLVTTRTLFSSSRSVEIAWVLNQLRHVTRGGERVLQVGDVLLRRALQRYDTELIDLDADEDSGPGLKVHKTDIRDTKLPPNHFDIAVSISTLEHIGVSSPVFPDGDRVAVSIIHEALKPGGWFLFTVPFGKPGVVASVATRVYDRDRLSFILSGMFPSAQNTCVVYDRFGWQKRSCEQAEQVGLLKERPVMFPGLALVKAVK